MTVPSVPVDLVISKGMQVWTWSVDFGEYHAPGGVVDVTETNDGHFLVTWAGPNQLHAVVVDASGQVVKQTEHDLSAVPGSPLTSHVLAIAGLQDEGRRILLDSLADPSVYPARVIEFAWDGSVRWVQEYPQNIETRGVKTARTADGGWGLLQTGSSYTDPVLVKYASDGSLAWTREPERDTLAFTTFCATADGGLMLFGSAESYFKDLSEGDGSVHRSDPPVGKPGPPGNWLAAKIDANGETVWRHEWSEDEADLSNAVLRMVETSDGAFVAVSKKEAFKFDLTGSVEWTREHGIDEPAGLVPTANGGFLVHGYVYSGLDVIVRFDGDGIPVWSRTPDTRLSDQLFGWWYEQWNLSVATGDGGFVLLANPLVSHTPTENPDPNEPGTVYRFEDWAGGIMPPFDDQ
jgi:hypothetical protein